MLTTRRSNNFTRYARGTMPVEKVKEVNVSKRIRNIFAICAVVVTLIVLGTLVFAATNLSDVTVVTGLTANSNGDGDWTSSNGRINGSVKTTSKTSCGQTTYTAKTGTLTLKNTSGSKATLSFTATPTLNGGSMTVNESVCSIITPYNLVLAANESVSIVLTSSDSAENTTSVVLSDISLVVEKNVNVTFTPPENGSYTVDGNTITSSTTITKKSTQSFAVSATPASGYAFAGWIVGGDASNVISTNATDSLVFTENATVTAYFIDNTVAVYDVAGNSFYSLTAAVN